MQAGFYRGKVALFIDPEINLDWRFSGVILSVSALPKTSSFAGNEPKEVSGAAKSGDGSVENVGIELIGMFKFSDCRAEANFNPREESEPNTLFEYLFVEHIGESNMSTTQSKHPDGAASGIGNARTTRPDGAVSGPGNATENFDANALTSQNTEHFDASVLTSQSTEHFDASVLTSQSTEHFDASMLTSQSTEHFDASVLTSQSTATLQQRSAQSTRFTAPCQI